MITKTLCLIDGLALTEANHFLLDFLVGDDFEKVSYFMCNFWERHEKQAQSIAKFRLYCLKQRVITYDKFLVDYVANAKNALEKLLLEPVSKDHMELLSSRLTAKTITIESLYRAHIKEPADTLMLLLK